MRMSEKKNTQEDRKLETAELQELELDSISGGESPDPKFKMDTSEADIFQV